MQQRLLFLLGVVTAWIASGSSWAVEPPKTAPLHLVWEAHEVLTTATRREMESLLLQHQHLTGERLFLVIAPNGAEVFSGSASDRAKKLFDHWGLETVSRGANALLLLQETAPEEFELGMHWGSGISWGEDGRPQVSLSGLPHWDAMGLKVTQEWLSTIQSPLAQSLSRLESQGEGATPRLQVQREWTWLWVLILMALSSALFYWTYRQILAQEVLISTERWVLFGPRLKVQLWLHRIPSHLVRGSSSAGTPEIHEHPGKGVPRA
jgi:hypothetical protein